MALREFSREELSVILKGHMDSCGGGPDDYALNLKEYLEGSFQRFFFTLNLIRKWYCKKKGKILEIGSFPFFLTAALLELSDDEVIGTVAPKSLWPGESYAIAKSTVKIALATKELDFDYWTLNAEKDVFPFENRSFDLVICTEVLEHLIQSPAHMTCEINRVMKDGGLLVLTTPNGLYWKHVYRIVFFGIWEQYSRYGVYGRHNRFWTENEVKGLLEGNNLHVVESVCNDSKTEKIEFMSRYTLTPVSFIQDLFLAASLALVNMPIPFLRKKKADQIYVVAKKAGPAKGYSPEYLYSKFKPSYEIR
jgi:SAM-dependent methyltransferase